MTRARLSSISERGVVVEERRRDRGPRVARARPVSSSGAEKRRRHVAVSIRNGRLVFMSMDPPEVDVTASLDIAGKTNKATWAGQ